MKRKYLLSSSLLLIVIGIMSTSIFGQDKEMKKNALQSMREWSKSFSPDQFKNLGYKDKAEFDKAELGNPFVLYTIDPNALVEYDSTAEFSSLFTTTGYIVYPIISEGKNKSLLWMYQKDNAWKIAKVGSGGISENMKINEGVIQKYREEYKFEAPEKPQMVRIYQLYLDFFFLKGEQDEYIIPMQTIPSLNIRGNTIYSVKDILPVLQEDLKQKMPFVDEEGNIKEF